LRSGSGSRTSCFQIDEEHHDLTVGRVLQRLGESRSAVLNVGGPGERKRPGIHGRALVLLLAILAGSKQDWLAR